MAEKTLNVRI
jgi:hypothetical protein